MNENKSKSAIFSGIIAALAASSCCISPVIVAITGVGGISSSLSWMEPLRPYLIGFAIIAIGYAWYVHLKPKLADDCGCAIEKPKWYQRRTFLIGMTFFATLSISFPYYSGVFYPDNTKNVVVENTENLETIEVTIEGMTCDACQNHVDQAVNKLDGIVSIETSYDKSNSIITFDKTQTNKKEIKKAVESTGYMATKLKVR